MPVGAGRYGISVPAGFGMADAVPDEPVVEGAVEEVEVVEEGAVMVRPFLQAGEVVCRLGRPLGRPSRRESAEGP